MPTLDQNANAAKDDFALVVGIGNYPKLGRNGTSKDLKGPVGDALDMTRWLVSEAGVPCQNVICLTSTGWGTCTVLDGALTAWGEPPVRPNVNDINSRFEKYVEDGLTALGNGQPRIGRRLWVYMSGHGFASKSATREICLIAADSLGSTIVRNICATRWVDWVAQEPGFDEVVLFLDCCSELATGLTPGVPFVHEVSNRQHPAKRLMIAAAPFDQLTFEGPIDGNGTVRGIFTQKLLRALRGAASVEGTGYLSTQGLRGYFENGPADDPVKVLESDPFDLIYLGNNAPAPSYRVPTGQAAGSVVKVSDWRGGDIGDFVVEADGMIVAALAAGFYKLSNPPWEIMIQINAAGVIT